MAQDCEYKYSFEVATKSATYPFIIEVSSANNSKIIFKETLNLKSTAMGKVEGSYNTAKLPKNNSSCDYNVRFSLLANNGTDTLNRLQIPLSSLTNGTSQLITEDTEIQELRLLTIENILIEQGLQNKITFRYNGKLVTYGVIKYQGRYWLDRNIGATKVATSLNDTLAYGDNFQWGREADGHQRASQTTVTKELAPSKKQPGNSYFITSTNGRDWNIDKMWRDRWFDGIMMTENSVNVCPDGWHVPNKTEWEIAIGGWKTIDDAFNCPLKLTATLQRSYNGMFTKGSTQYWSSTPSDNPIKESAYGMFLSKNHSPKIFEYNRSDGYPIRCIKNLIRKTN